MILCDWPLHCAETDFAGAGALQRCMRAAKSRRKSSRQRFTVFAPMRPRSASAGEGSSVYQFGHFGEGRRAASGAGLNDVSAPVFPSRTETLERIV